MPDEDHRVECERIAHRDHICGERSTCPRSPVDSRIAVAREIESDHRVGRREVVELFRPVPAAA
jgi:hypothetical protein